jgi:hypothetical protein
MPNPDFLAELPVVVATLRPAVAGTKRSVVLGGDEYLRLRDLFRERMQSRREHDDGERPVTRRKAFVSIVDGLELGAYLDLDEKGAWLEYNTFCDALERTRDPGLAEGVASDDALLRLIEGMVRVLHGADCAFEIS